MKNKKVLFVLWVLSVMTIWSSVSASDIDCSNIDRDELMTILEKQKNWETLTSTQQTYLTNSKVCMSERPEWTWSWKLMRNWEKIDLTDEQKAQMQEIQEIMEKQKNWETLTDDEQTKLDEFEANRKQIENNSSQTTSNYTNLTVAYKNKIDTAFKKIVSNISSYSDDKKLSTLETLSTKIETLKTQTSNSTTYTDSKKAIFNDIFAYLGDLVDAKINDINWEEADVDSDILDSLFN